VDGPFASPIHRLSRSVSALSPPQWLVAAVAHWRQGRAAATKKRGSVERIRAWFELNRFGFSLRLFNQSRLR
jgi:hypothetical protein